MSDIESQKVEPYDKVNYDELNPSSVMVYDKYTEITLNDTEFKLLATPGKIYVIKNKSGEPVYIAQNKNPGELEASAYQQLIGGTVYETSTEDDQYVWVRATKAGSVISIRPIGMLDPTADITQLGIVLNDAILRLEEHLGDNGNPHDVTKEQVGLGNIPNKLSNLPETNSKDILPTTALTAKIYEELGKHRGNNENPHFVTKAQVGLGNVDNFTTAQANRIEDCLENVDDKFVTPSVVYRITKLSTAIAYSVKPQIVVSAPVNTLISGWLPGECDVPTTVIQAQGNKHILIPKGIIVSYGTDHKVRISQELMEDLIVPIDCQSDTEYFIYVDIDEQGFIVSADATKLPPIYDVTRNNQVGDFFDLTKCIFYNQYDEPIKRCYLGTVQTSAAGITKIIPVPLGDKYIVPLGSELYLSGRYILDNPFLTRRVNVTPEVLYRDGFASTGWNDQIGVRGDIHPLYPSTKLVVQAGQMGFLACGRESGCAFGSAFTTITTSLRTRVVIQRQF